jgi:Uma2 family endonuclease
MRIKPRIHALSNTTFNDAMENVATATIEPDILSAEQSPVDMVNADNKETEYERERGKPMPTKNHGFVQANLIITLSQRYKQQYRIASEVTIGLLQRYATPDICLYPYSPMNMRHDEYPVAAPPLLVVEILSPSQSISELLDKAEEYFASGVQSCWIVQPPLKLVTVLHPNAEPQTFTATIVRDEVMHIEIPFDDIFA